MPTGHCCQNQNETKDMEGRLGDLRSLGIYDFRIQIEGLNEQYATALAEGQHSSGRRTFESKMERLAPYANEYNQLTTRLEDAYEQEAVLKKRYDLNKLDCRIANPRRLCGGPRRRRRQEGPACALADRRDGSRVIWPWPPLCFC